MPEPTASPVAIAITDEFLTLLAGDQADLGPADLSLAEWIMTIAPSFGAVAKAAASAEVTGRHEEVRSAALRLGADVLALVEQLDRESGRADEITGGPAPAAAPPALAPDEAPFEEPDPVVRHVDFTGGSQTHAHPAEADAALWNGDRWRSYLRNAGVRVADAVRYAQAAARRLGLAEPCTLDDIRTPALGSALRGWVDQQVSTA